MRHPRVQKGFKRGLKQVHSQWNVSQTENPGGSQGIAALAGSVWYAVKLYRRKKADYDTQAGSLESLRNSMDALESELRRYTSDPDLIHITGIGAERSKQITEAIEKLVRQLGVVGRTINDGAETEGYRALRDVLTTKRVLPHDSEIWNKVYDSVDEISPGFRDRIAEMSDGQVTEDDFRLACMIRLGFNMVAAAQIFGRTKSTMSYRRSILCEHLLGSSVSPSQLVTVIINL